jgi:protein-tyrosine phosphatase
MHLKHYKYNGWSHSEKVPPREEQFLQFVKNVENEAKGQSEERTIVVHCL